MSFRDPLFEPGEHVDWPAEASAQGTGPKEDREAYVFLDDRIVAAVNVAMAARRPLLVTGPPGGGKSTLARAVARAKGWAYVDQTITSRTELADLTAGVDTVRRLADAQIPRLLPDWTYVKPGVLWWAFDAGSAVTRGGQDSSKLTPDEREAVPEPDDPREWAKPGVRKDVVVLLDEIDKAEPDLPNDLLVPLDRFGFASPRTGWISAESEVLVVITSNGERRLPPAFLRRCVQLEVSPDSPEFFAAVARGHFGLRADALYMDVAEEFLRYRDAAADRGRREPSTAEYLDTVRACLQYDEMPGSEGWLAIVEAALWKSPALPEEVTGERVGASAG